MRRPAPLVVVASTLVGLVGLTAWLGPVDAAVVEPTVRVEPVSSAALVCPLVGGEDATVEQITALAIPGVAHATAGPDATPLTVRALAGVGNITAPDLTVNTRGFPATTLVDAGLARPRLALVEGPLAAGVVVEQSRIAQGTETAGLADLACAAPARDFWFVGGSSSSGTRTRVVLVNPSTQPAVVDVTAWDETGEISTPALQDVGVPAAGSSVVRLDSLASGSSRVAFRVRATEGRVVATADLRVLDGLDPRGLTWVPATQPPTTRQVLSGLAAAATTRRLQVLNPGDADAAVDVRLLTPDGSPSVAVQTVSVAAGTVADLDLSKLATNVDFGVLVTSDVPVSTAARLVAVVDGSDLPDLAVVPAGVSLSDVAATRLDVGIAATVPLAATLMMTAPDGDVAAQVSVLDGLGTLRSSVRVDVPSDSSKTVPVGIPVNAKGPVMVLVTPLNDDDSALLVARVSQGVGSIPAPRGGSRPAALFDVVPLTGSIVSVAVPPTGQDLSAGLP